jgi:hypothetical protein
MVAKVTGATVVHLPLFPTKRVKRMDEQLALTLDPPKPRRKP